MRKKKKTSQKGNIIVFKPALKPPKHLTGNVISLEEDHTISVPWFNLINYAKLYFHTIKCSQKQWQKHRTSTVAVAIFVAKRNKSLSLT